MSSYETAPGGITTFLITLAARRKLRSSRRSRRYRCNNSKSVLLNLKTYIHNLDLEEKGVGIPIKLTSTSNKSTEQSNRQQFRGIIEVKGRQHREKSNKTQSSQSPTLTRTIMSVVNTALLLSQAIVPILFSLNLTSSFYNLIPLTVYISSIRSSSSSKRDRSPSMPTNAAQKKKKKRQVLTHSPVHGAPLELNSSKTLEETQSVDYTFT